MTASAGYSGTSLAKKLGFKTGMRTWLWSMPASVRAEIDVESIGIIELAAAGPDLDAAHVFVTERSDLERHIAALRTALKPSGFVWISWPKKASKVPTTITEDVIRDISLPTGLVDVKVCAVDQTWSGLKLMIRRDRR